LTDKHSSVEKSKWLDRLKLLQASNDDKALTVMADADDDAQRLAAGNDKYIFLEYLEWMGADCFRLGNDIGELYCFNCKKPIGSWTWTPSDR